MELSVLFLGTGAADWDINDKLNGDEMRCFSSVMLSEDLLIDSGPHIFRFAQSMGYTNLFDNIDNILITHSHSDHFCIEILCKLCEDKKCYLWGDKGLEELLPQNANLCFHEMKIGKKIKVGNYNVTAIAANHSVENSSEQPLHYIIEIGGKTIFYGCDGAWLNNKSWHEILKHKFSLMVLDGTVGDINGDCRIFDHNNLKMVEQMCDTIKASGVLCENGKLYISHMSRTLHTDHQTLEERLSSLRIIPAHDNLCLRL